MAAPRTNSSRQPPPVETAPAIPDSVSQRLAALDSLLLVRDTALAQAESLVVRLREDSALAATAMAADSTRIAILNDSLARFMAFDSLAIRIDTITTSDSLLSSRILPLRSLLALAAWNSGLTVHQREEIPGFRRCAPVRAHIEQRGDTTWVRIDRDGKVFQDSVNSTKDSRIAQLERSVVRQAFGEASIPPEEVRTGWPWPVRAGVLAGTTLVAILTVVSLW